MMSVYALESVTDRTALPVELWDLIFNFVRCKADLAALSVTSSAFHDMATRYLYRSLSLQSSRSTIRQCHTLTHKPALARHVFSLSVMFGVQDNASRQIGGSAHSGPRPPYPIFGPAYCRLFFRAYILYHKLREVSFSGHLGFEELLHWNLMRFPAQPSYLEIGSRGSAGDILNVHPTVRKLYMLRVFSCNFDTLAPEALPDLQSVRCAFRGAGILIPGRPVTEVAADATTMGLDVLPRFLQILTMSSAPILRLEIKLRVFSFDVFRLMGSALPHLSYFVLTVLNIPEQLLLNSSPENWLSTNPFAHFQHLSAVELHVFYGPLPPSGINVPLRTFVSKVGQTCPVLDSVVLVDRGQTHVHEAAVPVYSGSRDAAQLTAGEDHWDWSISYQNFRNRRSPLFPWSIGENGFGDVPDSGLTTDPMPNRPCLVM